MQTVLCASLSDAVRVREVLDLMTEIEAWCDYRNAVVHDLMDKSVVSLDAHLAEQAELGYKLFRRLDNIVGWVAQVSMEQGVIQPKQFQQISEQCWNTQNLLGAWIISDQKRLNSGKQKQEPSDQGSAPE